MSLHGKSGKKALANRGLWRLFQESDASTNWYVFGDAGTLKSLFAAALTIRYARSGLKPVYMNEVELFKSISAHYTYGEDHPLPNLVGPAVVWLDDLGKKKPSEHVYEWIYDLSEVRWAAKRATLYTAQEGPRATALKVALGDEAQAAPLFSRFAAGYVLEVRGADHRYMQDQP